jgi:hypothetical protein
MMYIVEHRLYPVPKDDSGVPSSYKAHDTSRIGVAISCEQAGGSPVVYKTSRSIDELAVKGVRDR